MPPLRGILFIDYPVNLVCGFWYVEAIVRASILQFFYDCH
jgi:hypothetical protein